LPRQRPRSSHLEEGAGFAGQPWKTSALLWQDFTLAQPTSSRAAWG
jgi:hypothetical protein